jgi:hypothetical protein
VQHLELEPRALAQVQAIAAGRAGGEPLGQGRAQRRGGGGVGALEGDGAAEHQRLGRALADQREGLGGAVAVEQQVGQRGQGVRIVGVGGQRGAQRELGAGVVAELAIELAERGGGPRRRAGVAAGRDGARPGEPGPPGRDRARPPAARRTRRPTARRPPARPRRSRRRRSRDRR